MESANERNISRRTFIQNTAAGVVGLGAGAALSCADIKKKAEVDMINLEILEPHGELAFPERKGLFAPRLSDLNGKKIAIMAMGRDSMAFFDTIKSMLKNKYPTVEFVHFSYR